ncbi:hypothetical protein D3C75_836500 [compost metagenome]
MGYPDAAYSDWHFGRGSPCCGWSFAANDHEKPASFLRYIGDQCRGLFYGGPGSSGLSGYAATVPAGACGSGRIARGTCRLCPERRKEGYACPPGFIRYDRFHGAWSVYFGPSYFLPNRNAKSFFVGFRLFDSIGLERCAVCLAFCLSPAWNFAARRKAVRCA